MTINYLASEGDTTQAHLVKIKKVYLIKYFILLLLFRKCIDMIDKS